MAMLPELDNRYALFLDLDGTLLDLAATPDEVQVPAGLSELLRNLASQHGQALAILSGRRLDDIDELTSASFPAGAEHGVIRRDADSTIHTLSTTSANRSQWRAVLEAYALEWPGTLIETKQHGLVAHYRRNPEAGPVFERVIRDLLIDEHDAELLSAHMAWEIRPRGANKGAALQWFMRRPPFIGRIPVFVGDDVTDQVAIDAARDLGGIGLHAVKDFGDADGGPKAVRSWLRRSLARENAA